MAARGDRGSASRRRKLRMPFELTATRAVYLFRNSPLTPFLAKQTDTGPLLLPRRYRVL